MSDWELIQQYTRDGDPGAFKQLVRRHVDMVYSVARREVGDAHMAEDVTQAVFLTLARKAGGLHKDVVVPGWLFSATRLAGAEAMRKEQRRRRHEREAATIRPENAPDEQASWEQSAPLLNQAVAALSRKDRDAVVLRFFQNRSVSEVAGALRVSEGAAKQRVSRAVAKLRAIFARKGAVLSAGTLATVLAAHAAEAAPAHVAAGAVAAACSSAGSGAVLALSRGVVAAMVKAKLTAAGLAAVICVAVISTVGLLVNYSAADPPAPPLPVAGQPPMNPAAPSTAPKQAGWYLMDDEIYANKEAADRVREARRLDPQFSHDVDRDRAVALYAQAIDLQPGAPINALLAERIAQLLSSGGALLNGKRPDGAAVLLWWQRAHEWAEPGTELWGTTLFPNSPKGQDLAATVAYYREYLDLDDDHVRFPSWRILDIPRGRKVSNGPLAELPDPKTSASYEREMRVLRQFAAERKRTVAGWIVERCCSSLEWYRGGPEVSYAGQLAERTADAVKALRELSAKYDGTSFRDRFDEGIAEVLAQAATKVGHNPALPPDRTPPAPPDLPADTYLARMQAAANHALAADPPDVAALSRSLANAIEVQAWCPPLPDGRPALCLRYGKADRDADPRQWADNIVGNARGKVATARLLLPVPDELRQKRDRLLDELDAEVREELRKLLTDRLGEPENLPAWDRASPSGRIAIAWGHGDGHGPRPRYSVFVFVMPPPGRGWGDWDRAELTPLFPNLGLVGHLGTWAQDAELDATLKQVLADAMTPLKELEAEAAKMQRPEPPPVPDPREVALAAERAAMMRKEPTPPPATATRPVEPKETGPRARGTVVDAQTGEAIKGCRFVRGLGDWGSTGRTHYSRGNDPVSSDGAFDIAAMPPTNMAVPRHGGYILRVEAPGYVPQELRFNTPLPPVTEVTVRLKRGGGPSGVILTPDGKPAAGATVCLATESGGIPGFIDGKLTNPDRAISLRAGEAGQFTLPAQISPYVVVVAHETGYAEVADEDLPHDGPARITLRAWGRVAVTIAGGLPARGGLSLTEWRHLGTAAGSIQFWSRLEAGQNGQCHALLPAGEAEVILRNGPTTVRGVRCPVWFGQTTQVQIGGGGRTVTGRLVGAAEGEGYSSPDQTDRLTRKVAPAPVPESWKTMSIAQRDKWWDEFRTTAEGQRYTRETTEAGWLVIPYNLKDGIFTLQDVSPGEYRLTYLVLSRARGDGRADQDVTVPKEGPADLGDIPLRWQREGPASRPATQPAAVMVGTNDEAIVVAVATGESAEPSAKLTESLAPNPLRAPASARTTGAQPAARSWVVREAPWGETVNGLQCRLLVLTAQSTKTWREIDGARREVTVLRDRPVLEIRNASDQPIYLPLWRGELPMLDLSIKDHPELRSPISYGDALEMPHLLKPGEVLGRQLTGNASGGGYTIGFGRFERGTGWAKFDPGSKNYEV